MINKRLCVSGQSIVEYGLIGGLVLGVSVYLLILLGQTMSTNFTGMIGSSGSGKMDPGPGTSLGSPGSKQSPLTSPDTLEITTADGRKISLNIPNNVSTSIVTAGANGTTTLLAQSIEALAAQLKADGKIDEAGANALTKLANLAHGIARLEFVVEDTMQKSGADVNAALNSPVEFEGQTYGKVADLTALIKTGSRNPDGSYSRGSKINEFYETYSKLWPAGVMKDPQVAAILEVYVNEVASIADSNRVVIDQMNNGYGTPEQYRTQMSTHMSGIGYNDTARLLREKSGSTVTHADAVKICTTGSNSDTGSNCS